MYLRRLLIAGMLFPALAWAGPNIGGTGGGGGGVLPGDLATYTGASPTPAAVDCATAGDMYRETGTTPDTLWVCQTAGTPGTWAKMAAPLEFSIVPATPVTLNADANLQSAFTNTGDLWTLAASTTYKVEGAYYITKSGSTVTCAMAFLAGNGLTYTSIFYSAITANAAAGTIVATSGVHVETAAATVVNATSTGNQLILFSGLIRTNAAGSITPQIQFSGTPTSPVMGTNSYITFTRMGTNTTNISGNVD
jgi:hypothetical protein